MEDLRHAVEAEIDEPDSGVTATVDEQAAGLVEQRGDVIVFDLPDLADREEYTIEVDGPQSNALAFVRSKEVGRQRRPERGVLDQTVLSTGMHRAAYEFVVVAACQHDDGQIWMAELQRTERLEPLRISDVEIEQQDIDRVCGETFVGLLQRRGGAEL